MSIVNAPEAPCDVDEIWGKFENVLKSSGTEKDSAKQVILRKDITTRGNLSLYTIPLHFHKRQVSLLFLVHG